MPNNNDDFTYIRAGGNYVKEGKVKVKFSYKLKRFFGKLFKFIFIILFTAALFIFGFVFFSEPKAFVEDETFAYSRKVDYAIGDYVLVKPTGGKLSVLDSVLSCFKVQRSPLAVYRLEVLPFGVDSALGQLKEDEYSARCIKGCLNQCENPDAEGRCGDILTQDHIQGVLVENSMDNFLDLFKQK